MDDQLETQNIVPQELGLMNTAFAHSFSKAIKILKSNTPDKKALAFTGPIKANRKEKKSLRLLPIVFDLNRTMWSLSFHSVEVNDDLTAKGFRAGLRKDKITSISFFGYDKVSSQRIMETMCEGLKERSTAFQLSLSNCSSEFVKPILEASYLKCFSLTLYNIDCTTISRSVKNMIYRGSLYYISLVNVKGLKADVFLQLGRCLIPNLSKLTLDGTEVPTAALKHLIGSLKTILNSERSNVLERLDLGSQEVGSRLSFACFQLLRSDLVGEFYLQVKKDISRAVVKSICSTVAKTKNLEILSTESKFSSRTKFKDFILQRAEIDFVSPFGVNPNEA